MIELAAIVTLAILVDLIIGDPRAIPHPVVGMGKVIGKSEYILRKMGSGPRIEKILGVVLVLILLSIVLAVSVLVLSLALWIHPIAYAVLSVWLISTTIAAKGLKEAAMKVYRSLVEGDLATARTYVGYIVGRETNRMNDQEVSRATVETVAENTVDAVVTPVFYALIGGAPLALVYRAVNTLDSMVGYRNDIYRHFGWASARLDDMFNYIPARITGLILVVIAWAGRRFDGKGAWQAVRRDAGKHPSPNAGIPEAAVAGALGIQLGGRNIYGGVVSERARMGEATREIAAADIISAITIMMSCVYTLVVMLASLYGIGLWLAHSG